MSKRIMDGLTTQQRYGRSDKGRAKAYNRRRRLGMVPRGTTPSGKDRAQRIEWIDCLKMAFGCIDCGYRKNPRALQFDHVRGVKQGNIGNMKFWSWGRLLEELAKCELRCANCHAERTYEYA